MTERIEIAPEKVVAVVLDKWDEMSGPNIGRLAEQMRALTLDDGLRESQVLRREADANILISLQNLKELREGLAVPELEAIWERVSGEADQEFGGMIHGEDSRHYLRALRFVERSFLTMLRPHIEQEFTKLVEKCREEPAPEARCEAFREASSKLESCFAKFSFEAEEETLQKLMDEKAEQFDSMADLEERPGLVEQAKAFVYAVHRHLVGGAWHSRADSTLSPDQADRITNVMAEDEKVLFSASQYPAGDVLNFGDGGNSTQTIAYRAVARLLSQAVGPFPRHHKPKSPTAICDACGQERALRCIDSGQMICNACYAQLKPSRPKHLATYATLEAFQRKGIELPETTTRAEVEQLRQDLDTLHYLLMNAWYAITGAGFDGCGSTRDDLVRACYRLLKTGEFGQRMLRLEQQRTAIGNQLYQKALEETRKGAPSARRDYFMEGGALCSRQTGEPLAYWDFKPPLNRDDDFARLHELLREPFPKLGREKGVKRGKGVKAYFLQ